MNVIFSMMLKMLFQITIVPLSTIMSNLAMVIIFALM